jgi:DNA/RNA-binding domain of Phe-tRNA-synthetase-like protein
MEGDVLSCPKFMDGASATLSNFENRMRLIRSIRPNRVLNSVREAVRMLVDLAELTAFNQ